jgi:hypothetical protein
MLRLKLRQRDLLIEKLPDVANLTAASTFFGQLLTDRPFSFVVALTGVAASILLWSYALLIAREDAR